MHDASLCTYPIAQQNTDLYVCSDGGVPRKATWQEILLAAREGIGQLTRRGQIMSDPHVVRDFLRLRLNAGLPREVFAAMYLNCQLELLAYEEPFSGTVSEVRVYPREIARSALQHNARFVILAHNHPSGRPEPSQSDIAVTKGVQDALALIDVRVVDHFIVCGQVVISFSESGLI